MTPETERHYQRYLAAAHAMQSGVMVEQERGIQVETAKHTRTGINSAMLETAALLKILIDKGLVTEEEYFRSLADRFEEEVRRYEERISARMGAPVKLG